MKNINRRRLIFAISFLAVLSFAAIFLPWKKPIILGQTQSTYVFDSAFPKLVFSQPVGLIAARDGSNRLFVIEQAGVIRLFENSPAAVESFVFLNITSKVLFGGEQGLLGLAFHPNYSSNGFFYIDYVADNPRRTVIARYSVSPNNPNEAQINSELIVLEVNQPFTNHKGGQIAFGDDGYLYIGLGDGGSGGDPYGNAQNRSTLLGKILRINVDASSQGLNYSVPQDNPYSGNSLGYREEIYAYGFRNPWRFSFDSQTGRLWVGDVGQSEREEIDLVEKGKDYGWNIMEGTLTYSSGSQEGLELPVWEYGRTEGFAVIGGFVYRGSNLAELYSRYVYGDYGSGRVWALQYDGVAGPVNTLLANTNLGISSFGVDERNELYFCTLEGKICLLKSTATPTPLPTPNPTPTQIPTAIPRPTRTTSPTVGSTPTPTPSPTPAIPEFPSTTIIAAVSLALTATYLIYRKDEIRGNKN